MTDFRTSTTALEIDAPQLSAPALLAHPGTLPTITIPVADGLTPEVAGIHRYLAEATEFFAVPMPTLADVAAALDSIQAGAGLIVADVTVAPVDGLPRLLVTSTPVRPRPSSAVRIAVDDAVPHAHRATDPWWRRMAARTTSRGQADQAARWLADRGFVDCVSDGVPHLGALVFEAGARDFVGVENPEPTSVLSQLRECGVLPALGRSHAVPSGVGRAWWISPRFEVRPVAEIGGAPLPHDATSSVPFGRWE